MRPAKLNPISAAHTGTTVNRVGTNSPLVCLLPILENIDTRLAKLYNFSAAPVSVSIGWEKASLSPCPVLDIRSVLEATYFFSHNIMRPAKQFLLAAPTINLTKKVCTIMPVVVFISLYFCYLGSRMFHFGTPNNKDSSLAFREISIMLSILSCIMREKSHMLGLITPGSGKNPHSAHPAFSVDLHDVFLFGNNDINIIPSSVIACFFFPLFSQFFACYNC